MSSTLSVAGVSTVSVPALVTAAEEEATETERGGFSLL